MSRPPQRPVRGVRRVRRRAGARTPIALRRRRDYIRAGIGSVTAIAVAVLLVFLVGRTGHDDSASNNEPSSSTSTTLSRKERREQKQAQAFRQRMQAAYTRLVRELPKLSEDVDALDKGTLDGDGFLAVHAVEVTLAELARDQVAGIRGLPGDTRPKALYQRASMLYVEALRTFAVAATVEQPVRHEMVLQGKRVRTLADRVFDRGSKIVAVRAHDPDTPDIEVHLPEEVPNWSHEGYAAGPPVGSARDNTVVVDESKKKRPEQPPSAWRDAVRGPVRDVQATVAELPKLAVGSDVKAAVAAVAAADRAERAAERTRAIADPRSHREAFATLRLAMLVEAEAARSFALADAARAAGATSESVAAARSRGRDLALIGDGVWRLALADLDRPREFALPATPFDERGLQPQPTTTTTTTTTASTTSTTTASTTSGP